jgi:FkbM family methyltransferase
MGARSLIRDALNRWGLPVPAIVQPRVWRQYGKLLDRLGPGDLCIDCGANVGAVAARMGVRGARVHAFEPNPDIFPRLRDAVAHLPNVICHQNAVSDRDGTVRLFKHEDYAADREHHSLSSSTLSDKRNLSASDYFEVEAVDLARFIANLGRPVNLLKIDIEGAEYQLLDHLLDAGAFELIERAVVETHVGKVPGLADRDAALRARIAAAGLGSRIDLDWD